MREAHRKIFLK